MFMFLLHADFSFSILVLHTYFRYLPGCIKIREDDVQREHDRQKFVQPYTVEFIVDRKHE